jgi:excisionase family DNA binding protein
VPEPITLADLVADPARAMSLSPAEATAMLAQVGAVEAVLRARVGAASAVNGNGTGPLLTVEQVAAELNLKPSTVRAYAEQGIMPSVVVGNRLRFKRSDVGLWIARRYREGA